MVKKEIDNKKELLVLKLLLNRLQKRKRLVSYQFNQFKNEHIRKNVRNKKRTESGCKKEFYYCSN